MIMNKNARQPPRHLAAAEKGIRGRCKGLYIIFSKSMELSSATVKQTQREWSVLLQKLNEKKKQERKGTAAPRLVEEKVYCREKGEHSRGRNAWESLERAQPCVGPPGGRRGGPDQEVRRLEGRPKGRGNQNS